MTSKKPTATPAAYYDSHGVLGELLSEDVTISAYPDGVSGYGTYQQSGNVWEWCRDYYDQDFHRRMPPGLDNIRVLRGGAALSRKPWSFRCSFRLPGESCGRHEDFGFRIVRNGQGCPPR